MIPCVHTGVPNTFHQSCLHHPPSPHTTLPVRGPGPTSGCSDDTAVISESLSSQPPGICPCQLNACTGLRIRTNYRAHLWPRGPHRHPNSPVIPWGAGGLAQGTHERRLLCADGDPAAVPPPTPTPTPSLMLTLLPFGEEDLGQSTQCVPPSRPGTWQHRFPKPAGAPSLPPALPLPLPPSLSLLSVSVSLCVPLGFNSMTGMKAPPGAPWEGNSLAPRTFPNCPLHETAPAGRVLAPCPPCGLRRRWAWGGLGLYARHAQ